MRGMRQGVGAWAIGLSLLTGWGCGVAPDDLWGLVEHAPPSHAPIDSRIDRDCLEQQLTPYVDAIGAGWPAAFSPTGEVLVAATGRAIYSHGLGASDREQGSANTVQTSFRVGSITKGFTAAAILQLAEAGQLALGDTIGEHVPEYPAVGAGITLHQLLSHTAGLPNYTEDAELMARRDQPIAPGDLLATFWEKPLEFEPGTQFRYSNSGYAVLGYVIERITGQPYAEYMQRAVFAPAGLERTTVGDAEGLADRAIGYAGDSYGRYVPAAPIDMSLPYSAGAIRSTALDLARWDRVLSSDVLLGAQSRELLMTPVLDGYAYGWSISEQDGLEVVRHNGVIDGFVSDFVRVPELGLAVIVLLNAGTVSPESISNAALRCALGEDIPPEPPPPLVTVDAGQRVTLVGTYLISDEARQLLGSLGLSQSDIDAVASVDILDDGGSLLFKQIGVDPVLMLPTSDADFALATANATLHFSLAEGEALPANELVIEQGGFSFAYER